MGPLSAPLRITRLRAVALRVPIETPVSVAFGTMRDRPAVFLRIEDADGRFGWGEVFANWPAAGAEHRARLALEDVADVLAERAFADPPDLFAHLAARTRIRALQCREWGPFDQVIAGLDIAAWDLCARRARLPLARHLNSEAPASVPAYASGIHIAAAAQEIPRARALGFRRFKVKVGFDAHRDLDLLRDATADLQDGETLACDANQAWTLAEAQTFATSAADLGLTWIEEPMPADTSPADWATLANDSPTPLAGGENLAGVEVFDTAIAHGALQVIQPDIAKWGGITGCSLVAQAALDKGRLYCPHFLGGSVGLSASAHLLAAMGGGGVLEVDVNPNPLRCDEAAMAAALRDGDWQLTRGDGHGIDDPLEGLGAYITFDREIALP